MTKRFVKVYTTDLAVSVGEMKQIPKNSVLWYRHKKVVKFHISRAIKDVVYSSLSKLGRILVKLRIFRIEIIQWGAKKSSPESNKAAVAQSVEA